MMASVSGIELLSQNQKTLNGSSLRGSFGAARPNPI
jgi:hypothetical protein